MKELSSSVSEPTLPCCDVNCQFGRLFSAWLQSTTGSGKKAKQAEISETRVFKFLKYCFEQSGEDEQSVDFLDHLETTWQMGIPGRLGYVTGIADLLDFRRFNSLPGPVLQNFSVTEVYIKRTRQCLAKQKVSLDSLDDRPRYRQSRIQKNLGFAC